MKVEKIDITKTVLDLPRETPYYREVKRPGMRSIAFDVGQEPRTYDVTHETTDYRIEVIIDPEKKERRYYAVRVDERGLWNDLLKLSDGFVNQKITNAVVEAVRREYQERGEVRRAALEGVRSLSWWKRLFKKF